MKKITILLLSAAAVACSKNVTVEQTGNVNFLVGTKDFVSEQVKSNVSDFTALPSPSAFSIEIKDAYDASVYNGPVAGWGGQIAAGNYTVTATCGDSSDEGFDKPCFAGNASFTVKGGESVNVPVSTELSNCVVRMQTSENFANYYEDWTFTVESGSGTQIPFPKGETRGAFIEAYKFTVNGQITTQTGSVRTFSKEYQPLSPATCYTLLFDTTPVGGESITITFNDTVETVTLEDIELND